MGAYSVKLKPRNPLVARIVEEPLQHVGRTLLRMAALAPGHVNKSGPGKFKSVGQPLRVRVADDLTTANAHIARLVLELRDAPRAHRIQHLQAPLGGEHPAGLGRRDRPAAGALDQRLEHQRLGRGQAPQPVIAFGQKPLVGFREDKVAGGAHTSGARPCLK